MTTKGTARQKPRRDMQRMKVYRSELMAQHLLLGDYWADTMTEDEVVELVNRVLTHESILARWGTLHTVEITFPSRGKTSWASRDLRQLNFVPNTRNPISVMHEIAHYLGPTREEAFHDKGFIAVYLFIVELILGQEPARVLSAAFMSLGVEHDDSLIPSVRAGYAPSSGLLPGLLPGQAAQAAETIRLAAAAGVFGEAGSDARSNAFSVARKLKRLDGTSKATSIPQVMLPENVTIPVNDLMNAMDRSDVAEIVLRAIRKSMVPTTLAVPYCEEEEKVARRERNRRRNGGIISLKN